MGSGSGQWSIEKRAELNRIESAVPEYVPETGCLSIIVLGASGDLAKKKTFPALFHLYRQGFIQSHDVHIFGYARTKISDHDLRDRIRGYLTPCKGCEDTHEQDVNQFLQLIGDGEKEYTDDDLDQIREEWAQYVTNFIFRS